MTAIRSNKALKYNPIKPNEQEIIELRIIDVREFLDSKLFIISIQDALVKNGADGNEGIFPLTIRAKQFTFDEVDNLASILQGSGIVLEGTYTEQRLQLLQAGLLLTTQSDPYPIYFSNSEDWVIFNE